MEERMQGYTQRWSGPVQ